MTFLPERTIEAEMFVTSAKKFTPKYSECDICKSRHFLNLSFIAVIWLVRPNSFVDPMGIKEIVSFFNVMLDIDNLKIQVIFCHHCINY